MTDHDRNRPRALTEEQPVHWLDRVINKARAEGAFDNLPNTGKPLDLSNVSTDTEYDLAFTMLKNAGMAPLWIEVRQEADTIEAEMADLRARTRSYLVDRLRTMETSQAPETPYVAEEPRRTRRWPFRRSDDALPPTSPIVDRQALEQIRWNALAQHQELAESLDAKLESYHRALPPQLWHLQRLRRTAGEWQERFERECPPIESDAWRSILATT